MAYSVFTRKTPRMGSPIMSFSKLGQITFNQTAAHILQTAGIENILLMWDPEENKLGIQATKNQKDPRAYRLRFNPKANGASFSAKTFLDHFSIDYSERMALPIEINTDADLFLEVVIPDALMKRRSPPHFFVEKTG